MIPLDDPTGFFPSSPLILTPVPILRPVVAQIITAIENRQTVSFHWVSGLPMFIGIVQPMIFISHPVKTVDPYAIYPDDNSYFIGYWHEKKEVLAFSFSEIKELELKLDHFTIPSDFNAEVYFDRHMHEFTSSFTSYTVELLLDKEVGGCARQWSRTEVVKECSDGSIYVKFATNEILKVLDWILICGNTVKVVGPAVLVKMVQNKMNEVEMHG